jgi:CRP-like cAMP-binding protein
MASPAPANIKTYQDRKLMTLEADDYLFILKEFHRLLRRKLTPTAYALFCAIEDRAGPGDNKIVPAFVCSACHATLALDMNVKRITVQRTIPLLVESGVISIEKNIGETDYIRPITTNEQRAAYLLKVKASTQPVSN